jgi:hypothetical protein
MEALKIPELVPVGLVSNFFDGQLLEKCGESLQIQSVSGRDLVLVSDLEKVLPSEYFLSFVEKIQRETFFNG